MIYLFYFGGRGTKLLAGRLGLEGEDSNLLGHLLIYSSERVEFFFIVLDIFAIEIAGKERREREFEKEQGVRVCQWDGARQKIRAGNLLHFVDLLSVLLVAEAPSCDFNRENDVFKGGVLDGSDGSTKGSLLALDAVVSSSLGENSALSDDKDLLAGLLLELMRKLHLDLSESDEHAEGHKDDENLLIGGDFDLLGIGEVQVLKLSKIGRLLNVIESLGEVVLERRDLLSLGLNDLL